MDHIFPVAKLNPTALLVELSNAKHLWNQNTQRTMIAGGPFEGTADIWLRYADLENLVDFDFNAPHESVWYPGADELPTIVSAVGDLYRAVDGKELGGILITAIPPGGRVKPHVDPGWHAKYYDKYAIQLLAHPDSYFGFEDGPFHSAPGDVYWFNNQVPHEVVNETPESRVTIIVCIRS